MSVLVSEPCKGEGRSMSNPYSVTGLFVLLWDSADFAKGPGGLKEPLLVLLLGKAHSPSHRTCSLFLLPSGIAQAAQPGQPFLCPALGAAPHIALHISSQVGQGVDSAPPRHRHALRRSFCAAVPQLGLFLLCLCPRAGEPLQGCWMWVGRGSPSAGKARYSWTCFCPFAKAKRVQENNEALGPRQQTALAGEQCWHWRLHRQAGPSPDLGKGWTRHFQHLRAKAMDKGRSQFGLPFGLNSTLSSKAR